MNRRATAADVATAAGVSRSTVSYILNGSGRQTFSAGTVARVRAVAEELGYTPHAAARALRRGESGVVLLALPDIPASGNFAKLLSALTDGVRATNRSLVTLALRPGNRLVDILRDISPTALLEVLPLPEEDMAAASAASIPVVSVAAPMQRLDYAAAALQVRHVAGLGHRRLAVVTVREAWTRPFAASRLSGAADSAAELGLPAPEVVSLGGPDGRAVEEAATELARLTSGSDPVTAVCCFNDLYAGVTVAAARAAGLDVPGSLSVVGVDDEPLGGLLSPTLTSVRYDYTGMGRNVRDQLRHALDAAPPAGQADGGGVCVVERGSTSAPTVRR